MKTINIATDFSKYPGGRFRADGNYSGERFRDDYLIPALREHDEVVVEFHGILGAGSGWLEESFGGLIRHTEFSATQLTSKLCYDNSSYAAHAHRYIVEAQAVKGDTDA